MHLTKATCHRLTECFPASGELSSYWPSVALLLAHRRQRWPNNKPTLGWRLLLTGRCFPTLCCSILSSSIVVAVKSPFLRMVVYKKGCFWVIINQFHGTQFNKKNQTKRKINARATNVNKKQRH